jgi:hypothetical protein
VGFPAIAIFFLWIAMFQKKGRWAISRGGMTEDQLKKLRVARQCFMFALIPVSVVVLREAMILMCHDGCADGSGDGQNCF